MLHSSTRAAFQQSSSGHDVLRGLAGADVLSGGAGNDTITAYGAGDTLLGGDGADSLTASDESAMNGGRGHDWLRGTTGTFTFGAGFGQDTLVADLGNTATTIVFTDGINRSDRGVPASDLGHPDPPGICMCESRPRVTASCWAGPC